MIAERAVIPNEIPCAGCSSTVRVIVRDVVDGHIKYVGAKCGKCGLFIDTAGQSFESSEAAESHALSELRKTWSRTKAAIQEIVIQEGCEQAKAVEIFIKQNKIIATPERERRKR